MFVVSSPGPSAGTYAYEYYQLPPDLIRSKDLFRDLWETHLPQTGACWGSSLQGSLTFTTVTIQGGDLWQHLAATVDSGAQQCHRLPASWGSFPGRRSGLERQLVSHL